MFYINYVYNDESDISSGLPPSFPVYFYSSHVHMEKKKNLPHQFCYQEEPTENKAVPKSDFSACCESFTGFVCVACVDPYCAGK